MILNVIRVTESHSHMILNFIGVTESHDTYSESSRISVMSDAHKECSGEIPFDHEHKMITGNF